MLRTWKAWSPARMRSASVNPPRGGRGWSSFPSSWVSTGSPVCGT
ncbi:hypothetical protein ACFFX0_19605 [Citricoccus parietis]|uniref:Uncharacterized protein n=1 Tax=Citricoccus parietis TaxID=592307 RepID=A0ABV5G2W5_9MICC